MPSFLSFYYCDKSLSVYRYFYVVVYKYLVFVDRLDALRADFVKFHVPQKLFCAVDVHSELFLELLLALVCA